MPGGATAANHYFPWVSAASKRGSLMRARAVVPEEFDGVLLAEGRASQPSRHSARSLAGSAVLSKFETTVWISMRHSSNARSSDRVVHVPNLGSALVHSLDRGRSPRLQRSPSRQPRPSRRRPWPCSSVQPPPRTASGPLDAAFASDVPRRMLRAGVGAQRRRSWPTLCPACKPRRRR